MKAGFFSALSLAATLLLTHPLPAAEPDLTEPIAARYEQMLVRSPQPGTAFDNVVAWYSGEGGGLEVLESRWREEATASPADQGNYWILLALLAERQRDPARARQLYTQALAAPGDPAMAAKLLATLETTEGRFQEAAAAYRMALDSKDLSPLVRMELLRSLALLHQRSFENEKAGAVWMEAIATFPDDPYILEEAGEAFLASGDHVNARDCFEKLAARAVNDPFRKVSATLRLARAAEMAGDTEAAVAIYERALEETSPGSWIQRDVRSRIEELFRRKDDLPGLLSYYERRTAAVPADYESLAAMAGVLDELRRTPEALEKLRKAAALAPSSADLKFRLIEKLRLAGRQDEAIAAARELAAPSTASPEALSLLGDLLWDQQKSRPESRAEALAAFQRISTDDPPNPLFPRPGITRIVSFLTEILENQTLPMESKAEALASLTDNVPRIPSSRIVAVWNVALDFAAASNNTGNIKAMAASDLATRLSQQAATNSFAREHFNSVTHPDDIPTMPLVSLISKLGDPATTRAAIDLVASKEFSESNPARSAFLALALEAGLPASQPDASWQPRIDDAFAKASKNHSAVSIQHAASFLAEVLAKKNAPPDLIFALQTKNLDYLIEKNPTGRHDDVLLAVLSIARTAPSPQDPAAWDAQLARANSYLASLTNNPSSNTRRIASKIVATLEAAGHQEAAQRFKSLETPPGTNRSNSSE